MCLVLCPLICAMLAALSLNNAAKLALIEGVCMILGYVEPLVLVIYIHYLLHELL